VPQSKQSATALLGKRAKLERRFLWKTANPFSLQQMITSFRERRVRNPAPRVFLKTRARNCKLSTMGDLQQAREWIAQATSLAVLTGAGISAESGVPTFRGAGGLWKNYKPEELANAEARLTSQNPRMAGQPVVIA
jgi:hypothetical protein